MSDLHTIGEPAELAALYCAGAMPLEHSAAFEAHLARGCTACIAAVRDLSGAVEALLGGVASIEPDPHTRADLIRHVAEPASQSELPSGAQVWKRWADESARDDMIIRRARDAAWEETGVKGVRVRKLFVDQARNQFTAVVQMDPGASYPRHIHDGPEECLVLQGELHVGDTVLREGDYQRCGVGSLHGVQRTERGCLLLIVSSLSDEIV